MIAVESISVPGCIECLRFEKWWEAVKGEFPTVSLKQIDATTSEGMEKVSQYGIFASPGIIVNGELFSMGSVHKDALLTKLRALK